jgi:hypothetical protein
LLLCLLVAFPGMLAWAGEFTVTVIDRDLGDPLEGVELSLAGSAPLRTGPDGRATMNIEAAAGRQRLTASLIGYTTAKLWVEPGQASLVVKLALAGVSEGRELVVERAKPGQTDEQAAVSQVVTRDEIKNTAQIGIIQDLMSSIKLLPGVGYSGKFSAAPSIRGGAPVETRAALDGGLVWYPYQWGGACSIFDPTVVESAKLSNGLISSRYGQVISGMLEVQSRTPATVTPQFDGDLSTTGATIFGLLPFAENSGLMVAGKATWISATLAAVQAISGQSAGITTAPYILNGFARFYWKPSNVAEWDLNGFVGNDGVGMDSGASRDQLTLDARFDYATLSAMASSRFKTLIGDKLLLDFTGTWNLLDQKVAGDIKIGGTLNFDQDFIDTHGPLLAGKTSYSIDGLDSTINTKATVNVGQALLRADIDLAPGNLLSFGIEGTLQNTDNHRQNTGWADQAGATGLNLEPVSTTVDVTGNRALQSGAYALWEYSLADGLFSGELGARVDHSYLFNDTLSLNTWPVFNPRLRLSFNPVRNQDWVERFSIIAGSGLYSQLALNTSLFEEEYGLKDFDLGPDRAWFTALSLELLTGDGWKFSAEGYYKQYFDRFYITSAVENGARTFTPHHDGTGRSWGIDLMVQKRLSRYWDGWLTYSYNDTRYLDPAAPAREGQTALDGYLLGQEVYPGFHRFHTLKLVSDWKPVEGFSLMATATLASGTPRAEVGEVHSYLSWFKGQPIERFTRDSKYSDTLRTDLSCPVDLKASFSGYFPASTVRYEWYVAAQDVFVNLYSPKTNDSFDSFTGQTYKSEADFNVGFPLPSFGIHLSL